MGNYFIVYYDRITGEALVLRSLYNGDVNDATPEDDYENFPELRDGEGIGNIYVNLTEEIETLLSTSTVSVDVSIDPPELIFTKFEIPEKPPDQRDEVLQILGVEVE